MAMERISTVARDRSSRTCRLLSLLAVCAILSAIAVESCAQAPRPRLKSVRPQRPPQQAQRSDSELDTDTQQSSVDRDATTPRTAAADSELPEHVHPSHPLVPALKLAYASRKTVRNVRDYTAHFLKKELVGNRYITHSMDMKFRQQPFSVYLRFREPHDGRQVLYVNGANNGQILVQEAGIKALAGTIPINPTDPLAMSENRHPITEIGIANMLEAVIQQWESDGRYGEINVEYFPKAKLGDFPVRVIRTTHPTRRRQFKFHMTQLYLDDQTLFPVRVEQFDWPQQAGTPAPQVELYMYSKVNTNLGLSDQDFDPRQYRLR